MFALLCRFTKLDETNVFDSYQGGPQWPDNDAYVNNPQFSVSVTFLQPLSLQQIPDFVSSFFQSDTEPDFFVVQSGTADGSYSSSG